METPGRRDSQAIGVLVADSNQMRCQLLVSALHRRVDFKVNFCSAEADQISQSIESLPVEVAILNVDRRREGQDFTIIRRVHLAHPNVAKVLLLDAYDRDLVVSAFRSGVKGIFCVSQQPFRLLCKCIQSVHAGQIWANSEQLHYLLEALTQVPSLRAVNARGMKLLTPREEQVVALVADGLSNREVARELSLSEHTIKKYLFRVFDKLGISSRVELVLYAVNHGDSREAEWVSGSN